MSRARGHAVAAPGSSGQGCQSRADRPRRAAAPPGLLRGRARILLAVVIAAWCVIGLMPSGALAATGTPNDPLFASQWNLRMIGAPAAWQYSTGKGVIVGLVDTGVDLSHPDLAGQVLASTNCIGSAGDPASCKGSGQDDNGHGTHVAGIIDALTNNGIGVASVAPNAKLVVAKALDSSGAGDDADVEAGIEWVVNHGAKVVNLSLGDASILPGLSGSGGISQSLSDGITYAWQHGAIPVLAAGNSGGGLGGAAGGVLGPELGTDAAFGDLPAIVVGAVGPTGAVASYSSPLTADRWGLVAPGGAADGNPADDVVSTYWVAGKSNQYAALAGTSMAAPHVSGAIADLLALGYNQQSAVTRLLSTADSAVSCGTSCAGLLDLSAAVGGPPVAAPSGIPAPSGADPLGLGSLLGALGL